MSDGEVDVKVLDSATKIIASRQKSARRVMNALIVSLAFDVVLTLGIWYYSAQVRTVTQQAAIASCLSGNAARAANKHLWDELITLSKVKTPSPALLQFEHYLKAATKPRNCSATQ